MRGEKIPPAEKGHSEMGTEKSKNDLSGFIESREGKGEEDALR